MSTETTETTKSLWERVKNIFLLTLRSDEERSQANRHLGSISNVKYENDTFVFFTVNQYAADLLKSGYEDKLKTSFSLAGISNPILEFKLDESIDQQPIQSPVIPTVNESGQGRSPRKPSSFVSTIPLNDEFTFDEFVEGPSNSFALSAAKAVVKNPGKGNLYNPLFIHGGTGLGKTHLMQAIGNELKRLNPDLAICYITAETFLNEYINSLTNQQVQSFRYKYRNVDLLLVDDVQFLHKGRDNFQEEFFNTFNFLQQKKKQIVMTSDVAPKNLPGIEERLISRFEGGMVQEIESPSYETRLAILKKKTESQDISIPNHVLEFIADNIRSHVRAMEGALAKIGIVKMSNPSIILNNEVLSYILKDVIEKENSFKNITIDEIQTTVASKFGVTLAQMLSMERTQSIVTPRQLAMYISRKYTTHSLPEIAKKFDKTHATILHGVKTIKKRLDVEQELRANLSDILATFGYTISDSND